MEVTQLGYGAALRWTPDEDRVERVLNAVLDAGINFIDTSWCYPSSEELIGRYIGHRRSEYSISTKLCFKKYFGKENITCTVIARYHKNFIEVKTGWPKKG